MISVFSYQLISLFCTLGLGCFIYLPIYIRAFTAKSRNSSWDSVFSMMNAFVAGIFLSVGLVDMLHDSNESLEETLDVHYPVGNLLAAIGFLLIFFFETVVLNEIKQKMMDSNVETHMISNCCGNIETFDLRDAESSIGVDTFKKGDSDKIEKETKSDDLKAFFFAIAIMTVICVHSFIEGLALGFQHDAMDGIPVLIAVVFHKAFAAIAVGVSLARLKFSFLKLALIATIFVIMSPLGVAIGMIVQNTSSNIEIASGVLMGIGAGSFIYISALLLMEAFVDNRWWKMLIAFMGFSFMCITIIWA